jgi:drug/metabolite transporter (DMT)-like permease
MIGVITLFALFASLFSLFKVALQYSEPFFLIGSRMFLAGIGFLVYQAIRDRKGLLAALKQLPALCLFGFFAIYATNIAEIWGISRMVSARACFLYSLSPFAAAIIAYFVLHEVLTAKKWAGLCLGFCGVLPIVLEHSSCSMDGSLGGLISLGDLAIVFAVCSSSLGWILLKKSVTSGGLSPISVNGIGMTFGGILALLHSYLSGENWAPFPVTDWGPFLKNVLIIALISNGICYNLYGYLLKRYSASFISFGGLITPLFASFFGWFFLDESIPWVFAVSVGLFAIGLWLFYGEEKKALEVDLPPPETP